MRSSNLRITPAVLAAAALGDLDNALVAATPGGIEAQEAAGQAMLVASEQLPKKVDNATRAQLVALGFKFGADVDDLFVTATLPPGWKKRATSHSMHSDIVDDKGRVRASVFYKAAFYDRKADMRMVGRFAADVYQNGSDDNHYEAVVTDADVVCATFGEWKHGDYAAADAKRKECESWLDARFPQWRDPLAHWDAA